MSTRRLFIAAIAAFSIAGTAAHALPLTNAPSNDQQNRLPVVEVASKKPKPEFMRKKVRLETRERPGTIIINTNTKYLYFVEGNNRATRYGVGVGRDGFGWGGEGKIGRKAEWPDWRPPATMIRREAAKGRKIPHFVEGGINNPLGARAMYLYKGGRDTIYRIHGTNQPWTIGLNMSSGCIRMMNKDVEHLYSRAPVGTKVIVVGPGKDASRYYTDRGFDFFGTLFGG